MSIWSQINNEFEDNFQLHIDAWETEDENETGKVIAKIDTLTKEVTYLDERAKSDQYAQTIIKETICDLKYQQRTS